MCWRQFSMVRRNASTATEVISILIALGLGVAAGGYAVRLLPKPQSEAPPVPTENDAPAAASITEQPTSALAADAPAASHEELAAQIKAELLAELRQQVASVVPPPAAPASLKKDSQMGERTLAYWNQINDIMLREEQMRSVPLGGLTATNARDFLRRRGEAGKFAANAIRQLPGQGVDSDVLAIAADIAAWYDRGNELNSMGSFLLTKADATTRQGQPGQAWQDGEKNHQTSVEEINRRGDEVRRRMIEKYGLAFPDLR